MPRPCIYFCDVPVYRLSMEQYYKDRDAYVQKLLGDEEPSEPFYLNSNPRRTARKDYIAGIYGGCWNYNEIIGFIRLHFLGWQIRGEYYGTKKKRIVRTRKKLFEYRTHKLAPEISIPRTASNAEVVELIRRYIENCERELPRRYIDHDIFETIAPHVNWLELLPKSSQ